MDDNDAHLRKANMATRQGKNFRKTADSCPRTHNVCDRLCQLIFQHKLDCEPVKAYAFLFGTKTVWDAVGDQIENFVESIADRGERDRTAPRCRLNRYVGSKHEVVA
jgi:hypothetical protein